MKLHSSMTPHLASWRSLNRCLPFVSTYKCKWPTQLLLYYLHPFSQSAYSVRNEYYDFPIFYNSHKRKHFHEYQQRSERTTRNALLLGCEVCTKERNTAGCSPPTSRHNRGISITVSDIAFLCPAHYGWLYSVQHVSSELVRLLHIIAKIMAHHHLSTAHFVA